MGAVSFPSHLIYQTSAGFRFVICNAEPRPPFCARGDAVADGMQFWERVGAGIPSKDDGHGADLPRG